MADDDTLPYRSSDSDRTQPTAAPTVDAADTLPAASSSTGSTPTGSHEAGARRIGPYSLREQLGEGGFGAVYRAEQQEPVRRSVALKLIKAGMDSRDILQRFAQERQALAIMDHPAIAKVFDAGTTEDGRPYFAMEYVVGSPITAFSDVHRLSVRARLELFLQVCAAVQHAHQKGVIHRDLKPSNILVAEGDSGPLPKVIDFGIAKAVELEMPERTMMTMAGQFIGTPAYVSPEQAAGAQDIDTRSDVYALGTVLYELLTGVTPVSQETMLHGSLEDLLRTIREVDPPTPSERLRENAEASTDAAAQRGSDARHLVATVRGDLDWIVMKALEKDRTRRYDAASALAADVRRYLDGAPVVAAPASAVYRARKFVRRHKAPVIAASVVIAALVCGLAGTLWQSHAAQRARDVAAHERDTARAAEREQARLRSHSEALARAEREQRTLAQSNATRAESEATRATRNEARAVAAATRAVAQSRRADLEASFLRDLIGSVDPDAAKGRDISVLMGALDSAAVRLAHGELKDSPEAEVFLRSTLGEAYWRLGRDHEAVAVLRSGVPTSRAHSSPKEHAKLVNRLGLALFRLGDLDGAQACYEEALTSIGHMHRADSVGVALMWLSLASVHHMKGDHARAVRETRLVLAALDRFAPQRAVEHANAWNLLGLALHEGGDAAGSVEPLRQAIRLDERLGSADVVHPLGTLAGVLQDLHRDAEAESTYLAAVAATRHFFPDGNATLGVTLNNLASLHEDHAQWASMESTSREAVTLFEKYLGHEAFVTANARARRGRALVALHQYGDAEVALLEAERVLAIAPNVPHGRRGRCMDSLAALYDAWDAAEPGHGHAAQAATWRAKRAALGDS